MIGKYVRTFAEATHALPQGMDMGADYPFVLAKIEQIVGDVITIVGRGGARGVATIERGGDDEWFWLAQSSSFEKLFHRKPQRFRFAPFKENP